MHRTSATVLSAAAITMAAAFGLSGCGSDEKSAAPTPERATSSTADLSAPPSAAPLPAPEALTAVLYRLADTSIPADQKLSLVQYSTADDQAALGNFAQALVDGGFREVTVAASDVAWSSTPGNVVATVTIGTADDPARTFTFPMEFNPVRDHWQLTRKTADQLLELQPPAPPAEPTPPTPPR